MSFFIVFHTQNMPRLSIFECKSPSLSVDFSLMFRSKSCTEKWQIIIFHILWIIHFIVFFFSPLCCAGIVCHLFFDHWLCCAFSQQRYCCAYFFFLFVCQPDFISVCSSTSNFYCLNIFLNLFLFVVAIVAINLARFDSACCACNDINNFFRSFEIWK